jgi:lambda family phage tail tape measure protein
MNRSDTVDIKFNADFATITKSLADLSKLSDQFSSNMVSGLKSAVVHGRSFDQVLKRIALNLAGSALNAGLKPLQGLLSNSLSSLFGGIRPFAKGGVISGSNRVQPFAKGGVVATPTFFPMRGGTGLMGEAGAEAIMPLSRSADGRLGVQVAGNGGVNTPTVQVTINTPDAPSFRQSEAQVTAALTRAVQRGSRNL